VYLCDSGRFALSVVESRDHFSGRRPILENLTIESFRPRLGDVFRVSLPDGEIELTLSQATEIGGATAGKPRVPFSLLFHGHGARVLPQGIYHLENDHLAPLDIFIVPLGPDERGMRYEAIFT
jgi:hypothetical protein